MGCFLVLPTIANCGQSAGHPRTLPGNNNDASFKVNRKKPLFALG